MIKNNRIFRFISEIPEVLFAIGLIIIVIICLYFFEKPEGFIHDQFPGVILNIAVFGILIIVFNKITERKRDIKRWREEIIDYLPWKEPEAAYRIAGIIKRLNRLGVGDIYLALADLQKTDLSGANLHRAILAASYLQGTFFTNANLQEANLRDAILSDADLQDASLRRADLWGATPDGADLSRANLQDIDLRGASLRRACLFESILQGANLSFAKLHGAVLSGANLEGTILKGAKLQGADMEDAYGLTLEQISEVYSLWKVTNLDEELMKQIREKFPHLLNKPKKEEMSEMDILRATVAVRRKYLFR